GLDVEANDIDVNANGHQTQELFHDFSRDFTAKISHLGYSPFYHVEQSRLLAERFSSLRELSLDAKGDLGPQPGMSYRVMLRHLSTLTLLRHLRIRIENPAFLRDN